MFQPCSNFVLMMSRTMDSVPHPVLSINMLFHLSHLLILIILALSNGPVTCEDIECSVRGLYNGQPVATLHASTLDSCVFAARSYLG